MFCKHDWEILESKETETKFSRALKTSKGYGLTKIPWQMCDTSAKLIQIVACNKCGKLKRFVTEI